jgi:hypothetical protein
MDVPEVVEYPDSGKFGVYSVLAAEISPPGGGWSFSGAPRVASIIFDGEG